MENDGIMIRTKSIYKEREDSDGVRASVMSRHTLEDGFTPDPKITRSSYDVWLQGVSPPANLVGDYYRRGLPFDEYTKRYLEFLRTPDVAEEVKLLAKNGLELIITLLCVEESAEFCHRRILAEECKRYEPGLVIEHK